MVWLYVRALICVQTRLIVLLVVVRDSGSGALFFPCAVVFNNSVVTCDP